MPKTGLAELGREMRFCSPLRCVFPTSISPVNWQRGSENSSLFPSDTNEDSAKNPTAKYRGTGSLIGLQFKCSFVKTRSFLEHARGWAVGMWDKSRRVGAAWSPEFSWLLSSLLSFCLVLFQNEDMGDMTPAEELEPGAASCQLFDPSMRSEARRLRTFWQWPHTAPVSARDLAKAGFFFVGPRDQVQCFCCGGVLMDWGPGDCPVAEHLKFFSSCKFIRGEDAGNQEMFPLQEIFDTVDGQFLSLLQGIDSEEAAPQNPEMVTEEMRLSTFRNWPQYSDMHPEQLARAGFFYTGRYSTEMFLTLTQVNFWRCHHVLLLVQILVCVVCLETTFFLQHLLLHLLLVQNSLQCYLLFGYWGVPNKSIPLAAGVQKGVCVKQMFYWQKFVWFKVHLAYLLIAFLKELEVHT